MAIKTAVVIAGAVARGAYEAGALAKVLSEKLTTEDLRHTLFLGTSAGAINAVLWAGFADGTRSVDQIGEAVCDVWKGLDDTDVFAPLSSVGRAASMLLTGQGAHFLDTTPLAKTVREKLAALNVNANIEKGHVAGVALAATFCGESAAGARSDIFYKASAEPRKPRDEAAHRYLPVEEITHRHVLASSAVPALFEPVEIDGAYYVDGGVRLNTPLDPAIDFHVERIILVSSHATCYPKPVALRRAPNPDDSVALAMHSLLADKTIEDLARMRRINKLLLRNAQTNAKLPFKLVEHIVVSPEPGLLASKARAALDNAYCLRPSRDLVSDAYRAARYLAIETVVERLGSGCGANELLSYLLFDKGYFVSQIEQGIADATKAAAEDWQLLAPSDRALLRDEAEAAATWSAE
jgi:NTE family protein